MFRLVICHDETVKVRSKNCDELINFIDRVSSFCQIAHVSLVAELSPYDFFCEWIGKVSSVYQIVTICSSNASCMKMYHLLQKVFSNLHLIMVE